MKIVHNKNVVKNADKELGEVQKSLTDIQSLINSHWSDSESVMEKDEREKSLFKKLVELFKSKKKDELEIVKPLLVTLEEKNKFNNVQAYK